MKYIGYYDSKPNRRLMSLAAVNKMDYISSVLERCGYHVNIIACGMLASKKIKKAKEKRGNNTEVIYFTTLKRKKILIGRILLKLYENIRLLLYLLNNVKANEKVIVYHSLLSMRCLYLAKKIKRFYMILEVEEIYNDVSLKSCLSKRMEEKLIHSADAYIFSNKLLNAKYNLEGKPSIVIHGAYQVEPCRIKKTIDNRIHIIYAGTFDLRKGGVLAAISAAEFLSEKYHIHILGFGAAQEVKEVKEKIQSLKLKTKCEITYDGMLTGEDYIDFLQSCAIGLSTQNPEDAFNETSFPSKILSYMANGLRVISIRIPAVENSNVGKYINYYDKQSAIEIANAIMNINFSDGYDSRELLKQLDKEFVKALKEMIQ